MSISKEHNLTRRSLLLSTFGLIPGIHLIKALDFPAMTGSGYTVKPVPLTEVDILDDFWAPRMELNREVSIWHCFNKMEEPDDFGSPKLIEAAAYMLAKRPDRKLEEYVDQVIGRLVRQLTPRLTDPDQAVRLPAIFLRPRSPIILRPASGRCSMQRSKRPK